MFKRTIRYKPEYLNRFTKKQEFVFNLVEKEGYTVAAVSRLMSVSRNATDNSYKSALRKVRMWPNAYKEGKLDFQEEIV
tara:strand:- start:529 stop:765 length:237 start_codon:yes stop_codon:yes gene_type:complete